MITRVTSATSPTRIFTFPTVRNILQAKIPRKSTCELLCSNFKCAYTTPSDQCVQSGVTFCLLNYFRSTRGQIHIHTFPLPKVFLCYRVRVWPTAGCCRSTVRPPSTCFACVSSTVVAPKSQSSFPSYPFWFGGVPYNNINYCNTNNFDTR